MDAMPESPRACYAVKQLCRKCGKELGANHRYTICERCILTEATKRDSSIASYSDIFLKRSSTVRWLTWQSLKVHKRKPVQ